MDSNILGRINSVYSSLIVSKDCRTVGTHSGKLGACPVKDRHEIVAYHMDACLAEPFQGSDIILYILFTVGRTDLDGIVNVDTRYRPVVSRQLQSQSLGQDVIHFPDFRERCRREWR